ncbi:MAG: hypothetical protein [Caudoviricetes sp.]|nr:MAG: hypothetical protein [Caudoviricetes sp.]
MHEKSLKQLLEDDTNLDQAKLVIAAQDILDRLQKIAEHLAELTAEEIMPLSDNMKAAFGADVAQEFEKEADQAIQTALQTVRTARDVIDSAILRVQGEMPSTDMASYDNDIETSSDSQQIDTEANTEMQNGDDTILSTSDGFDGAEAAASEEPMGRPKRESIENDKKSIVEGIFNKAGKLAIKTSSLNSLVEHVLSIKKNTLSDKSFNIFKEHLNRKIEVDPISVAGWIAITYPENVQKNNKVYENIKNLTSDQKKAYGIAKVIEANIISTGHGKAASVVRQFSTTDLRENAEKTLTETFKDIFGVSPAVFSVSLQKKIMGEDITPSPNPSPETDPTQPPTQDMTNVQKANAAKGIAKMAADVGTNVANGNKPVSAAVSDLDPQEKTAVNDVVDDIQNTTGTAPEKVSDLLQKASDVIGEDINKLQNCPDQLIEGILKYNKKIGNTSLVDKITNYLNKGK